MKKLFKISCIVAILLVSLGATLQSCSSSDPATLAKEYAEIANEDCPIDEGDGIVVEKVTAQGTTVTLKMEAKGADVSKIKKETFIGLAKEDNTITDLINKGVTYKITVCNGDQCKSITITKEDINK